MGKEKSNKKCQDCGTLHRWIDSKAKICNAESNKGRSICTGFLYTVTTRAGNFTPPRTLTKNQK